MLELIQAWDTPEFVAVFKRLVANMTVEQLPLQQGLQASDFAVDKDLKVLVLNIESDEDTIKIKAGVFYQGMVSGCHCADDPSPQQTNTEYCELLFVINKQSGLAKVTLI